MALVNEEKLKMWFLCLLWMFPKKIYSGAAECEIKTYVLILGSGLCQGPKEELKEISFKFS